MKKTNIQNILASRFCKHKYLKTKLGNFKSFPAPEGDGDKRDKKFSLLLFFISECKNNNSLELKN